MVGSPKRLLRYQRYKVSDARQHARAPLPQTPTKKINVYRPARIFTDLRTVGFRCIPWNETTISWAKNATRYLGPQYLRHLGAGPCPADKL
ncbi:b6 [miniopterid betaherpesvirus 1]|uniref:B6 n=1 Tax=miniopterid betaherpesvirus 1 TaxID=3070189 RepID=I3VPY7_9BETA|nr:b6 [miniopterid betaherpesvirus 1]AFK83831.1 b6 [miniopterid betaherpesvirus 1]